MRACKFKESLRLFYPDDQASSGPTPDLIVRITLMDYNARKTHTYIGETTVPIKVGIGTGRYEVKSERSASLR